jgi:hypothetical protein
MGRLSHPDRKLEQNSLDSAVQQQSSMEDTRSNRSQGGLSFTSYVKHKKSGKLDSLSQQSVVLPKKR